MHKADTSTPAIFRKLMANLAPGLSSNKCWQWTGGNHLHGYGNIAVGGKKSPWYFRELAHRFSYRYFNGCEIPADMQVCHKCDNRGCCNPDHLFLGTAKDNFQDMVKKGRGMTSQIRSVNAQKTYKTRKKNIFGQVISKDDNPLVRKGTLSSGASHSEAVKKSIPRGERHYHTKLTQSAVNKMFELRSQGLTYKQIGFEFNVDPSCVYKIIKKKRWSV